MTTQALILVDLENEWRDSSSDYFVGDLVEFIQKTNTLIDYCRQRGDKIIFIRHVDQESDGTFAEDSHNTTLFEELHRQDSDTVITKYAISPFYETSLAEELE